MMPLIRGYVGIGSAAGGQPMPAIDRAGQCIIVGVDLHLHRSMRRAPPLPSNETMRAAACIARSPNINGHRLRMGH